MAAVARLGVTVSDEPSDSGVAVEAIDHVVFIVDDIEETASFYTTILGMERRDRSELTELHFGTQKIHLHPTDSGYELEASNDKPGTNDVCFLTDTPLRTLISHLERHDIDVEEGPVERQGATSELLSVYFRDPDGNLIEVSRPIDGEEQ